ncbi:hypothetical protein ACOM2C_00055 [Pseudarthrobacter sp. So.54]
MTEPNHIPETGANGDEPRVIWPAMPGERADASGQATSADAGVAAVLERLGTLPDLPVARHGDIYAGLHDDLLAALNEPITTTARREPTHEQA